MIHVCFALHDKTGCYSKFTGTTMCSIFENASSLPRSITIHILHDNTLTNDNRDKFIYLTGRYNQIIKFYNVEKLCLEKITEIKRLFLNVLKSGYAIEKFYRFFIPQILTIDIKKVVYLNSDTIVNLDVDELWQINLEDKPLGAVNEEQVLHNHLKNAKNNYLEQISLVKHEDYFCTDTLMINLDYWRNNEPLIIKGFQFASLHTEMAYIDQDVLNYLFSKNYVKLPESFNILVSEARKSNKIQNAIYHYRDALQLEMDESFNRMWREYFVKTPWFNASIIINLYNKINDFGKTRRALFIELSAALSGKTRTFVVKEKKDISWLKKVYSFREDEEVFIYEDKNSLQKLIDKMNISRDKKVFFIRVNDQLIKSLNKAGFVEGKDFFNHYELFSSKLLTRVDAQSLIKII